MNFAPSALGSARWRFALLALFLLLVGGGIFYPVHEFEFLNFDDGLYLENNPYLKQGFSWQSLHWALTANLFEFSRQAEYWMPLTLCSRLLDAEMFGLNAGGHHVSSALLHLLNAGLLFLALRTLTQAWWRPAFVAALFLVHPLNVEPVAWLSARKDLLSATFFFLTLAAYGHYAAAPSRGRYAWVLVAFLACLMSKPMGVTTPAVLLLLDFWPLDRWKTSGWLRLVLEKLPLWILAGVAAFLAFLGQKDWGAVGSMDSWPITLRLGNALLSYATFLRRIVWPNDLTLYYPHPGIEISWSAVTAGGFLLLVLSACACAFARTQRFLLIGWLWFLGVLVPVIGLVQVGNQGLADRYAYTSVVGIFIAVIWGGAVVFRGQERLAGLGLIAVVSVLGWVSSQQIQYWRNSETAFTRAVAVTEKNDMAYLNLGNAYYVRGDWARARENFSQSLRLRPNQANGWNNLGAVETALGHDQAAMEAYAIAIQVNPTLPKSFFYYGKLLLKNGEPVPGEACLRRAIELQPGWGDPYLDLAKALIQRGAKVEAAQILESYLRLRPNDPAALALLNQLG